MFLIPHLVILSDLQCNVQSILTPYLKTNKATSIDVKVVNIFLKESHKAYKNYF